MVAVSSKLAEDLGTSGTNAAGVILQAEAERVLVETVHEFSHCVAPNHGSFLSDAAPPYGHAYREGDRLTYAS